MIQMCHICRAANNPLGKTKFTEFLDGNVYCERCLPCQVDILDPAPPREKNLDESSSNSMVVVTCPDCRNNGAQECDACSGYGAVRVPLNFLNIYVPKGVKPEP